MLEKERQVAIMERLKRDGFVSVRNLMSELNASRSSVMRDLIALEAEGLLVREHGGASLQSAKRPLNKETEAAVTDKKNMNVPQKQAIAQKAAEKIREGMCIYIDSGTTTPYLIPYIADKQLLIVTPSIYFLRCLPGQFRGTVYIVGGQYDQKYDMAAGDLSLRLFRQFNFDAAFFSANGINLKNGDVTLADFTISALKKTVMEQSRQNYLLADSSKLNETAACTFAYISDFDEIITSRTEEKDLPENFTVVKGDE